MARLLYKLSKFVSFSENIEFFPINFTMMLAMNILGCKLKIFRVIICFYFINMMSYFKRVEITIKFLFENKAVFKNITFGIAIWMIRSFDRNISISYPSGSQNTTLFRTCRFFNNLRRIFLNFFITNNTVLNNHVPILT